MRPCAVNGRYDLPVSLCRCVPRLLSKEALLILIQGAFLVSRTFLTDRISRIEARAGRHLISQVR